MYIVISSLISLYTICCSSPSLHLPVRPIFHCCTCAVNASIHICNSSLPPALPPLSLSPHAFNLSPTHKHALSHTHDPNPACLPPLPSLPPQWFLLLNIPGLTLSLRPECMLILRSPATSKPATRSSLGYIVFDSSTIPTKRGNRTRCHFYRIRSF